MIKFIHVETGQDPENKIIFPTPSGDGKKDGDLITKVLLSNHGLDTDRFKKLTYEQMIYCENLLCTVVQNLCNHLTVLSHTRTDSTVYMKHLESLKK